MSPDRQKNAPTWNSISVHVRYSPRAMEVPEIMGARMNLTEVDEFLVGLCAYGNIRQPQLDSVRASNISGTSMALEEYGT